MDIINSIVLIVFGILQIILFFKIWGMTNDIKAIREKYLDESHAQQETSIQEDLPRGIVPGDNCKFKENDLVVLIKTGKQMRVKFMTDDNKYSCYTNNGTIHQGDFDESEIKLFGTK